MPSPIRILPLTAGRSAAKATSLTAYRANPLTLRIALDRTRPTATGLESITAEIRRTVTDTTAPLASVTLTNPTGAGPFDLTFDGAQTNQDLAGKPSRPCWLVVYGTANSGETLDIWHAGGFTLLEHGASQTAAAPPNVVGPLSRAAADAIYATLAQLSELDDRLTAVEDDGGSGIGTNLGYTAGPTHGIVTSNTGSDATIPLANGTHAGLLSPAQAAKLANLSGTNTGDHDLTPYLTSASAATIYLTLADAESSYQPTSYILSKLTDTAGGYGVPFNSGFGDISYLEPDVGYLTPGTAATIYATIAQFEDLDDRLTALEEGGVSGADGASAYEVAAANGFVGDETAWLASLVGTAGESGSNGADGASAYELAVANGFVGDETAWLASLVGPAGAAGATGATGATGPAGADAPVTATITEPTTARTLALTDAHQYIRCTNASAVTVTVPPQSSVAWAANTVIYVRRATGAGAVTAAPGSGVTINDNGSASVPAGGTYALRRIAADTWDFI